MTALVTLDEYKEYKKLSKSDNDQALTFIINSTSDAIKEYCGHSFVDYVATIVDEETVDNFKVETLNMQANQDTILLMEWPVIAIEKVEYRTSYLNAYEEYASTDYFLDPYLDALFIHSGYWPEGFGSIKVTYNGGYTTVPDDIKIATLDLVHHYFKEEYKERKQIGQVSIDNSTSISAKSRWPGHIIRILDMYRNV